MSLERFVEGIVRVTSITRHIHTINIDHGHTAPPPTVEGRQHLYVLTRQTKINNLQNYMITRAIQSDVTRAIQTVMLHYLQSSP